MSKQFSPFAEAVFKQKYSYNGVETWEETAKRVVKNVMGAVDADNGLISRLIAAITARKFLPGGRYLYAAGRPFHQTQNCLLLRAEDSREGWADLMQKATMSLMTGAGIGIDYSAVRGEGEHIRKTGGKSTGPLALMQMVNEAGRHIMQGGARRSAIWAGLNWKHADVLKFIEAKNWSEDIRKMKETDYNAYAPLDGTNISVILDRSFFRAYNSGDAHAKKVYTTTVRQMLSTAEPGFSVDYTNKNESLRNACTEAVSEDDSDVCNLGSLNLARIESLEEMKQLVSDATAFLLAGTVYSDLPYAKVAEVRAKNRRIGLGIMGVHEWLLRRGYVYGPNEELAKWLEVYEDESDSAAGKYAKEWRLRVPVKVRSIAPTGTIGIIAETTTGIEPLFCVAYRRRYKGTDGKSTMYQYVVDPTAKRLVEQGVRPEAIEDAYTLSEEVERRVAFQAWVQEYVDQAISSTINLPPWGSTLNNEKSVKPFGEMLLKYLPKLRGITCYPDGCRSGQPLVRVSYETAMQHEGQVFLEQADMCDITKGGSCGT